MATTPTLRPLGVGEILDAGIRLYLRHWKPLMICVVGIVLPVRILSVVVVALVDPNSLGLHFDTTSNSSSANVDWTGVAALLIVGVATVFGSLLATAACFRAVADAWLGAAPDAGRSLRFALARLPALLWLLIAAGIALALALLALILPFFWLAVAWSLAVPALLLERVGPVAALRRSFELVRGRWWPTAATVLVGYLIASIVGGVFELVPLAIADGVAGRSTVASAVAEVIGGTLASTVTMPFTAAVLTLLYFDQRVRKEGFDLERLAGALGTERDPDAPLPAALARPQLTPEQRAAAPYWPPPPGWTPPEPVAAEPEWWRDPSPPGLELGGFAPPRHDAPTRAEDAWPRADGPEDPARDRRRADWLPPEAPRGPGGL